MSLLPHLHRRRAQDTEWYYLCETDSTSATWYFDRFRLYYPDGVSISFITADQLSACEETPAAFITEDGRTRYIKGGVKQQQPFHSGGGWTTDTFEHDFSFDLSNTGADSVLILISPLPPTAKFQQIYTYPTGFGATRGSDARIVGWDFYYGVSESVGGADGTIKFNNQPIESFWADAETPMPVYAKNITFEDSELGSLGVSELIHSVDIGEVLNGTLNYLNAKPATSTLNLSQPSSDKRVHYDSIISKGWVVLGREPARSEMTFADPGLVWHLDPCTASSYSSGDTVSFRNANGSNAWDSPNAATAFNPSNGTFTLSSAFTLICRSDIGYSLSTGMTVTCWIKTTELQALFFNKGASGQYMGAYRVGNKGYNDATVGGTIHIDLVPNSNLYDTITDNTWHFVEFKNVNLSAWTNFEFSTYPNYDFGNGELGNITIHNKILTDAESAAVHDATRYNKI